MLRTIIMLPAVVFLSLIGCQTTAQETAEQKTAEQEWAESGAVLLSTDQLKGLYTGSKISWADNSYGSGTASYNEDGTASAAWDTGSTVGTWRVLNGMLCTKWVDVRPGRETCYHVYDSHDGIYATFLAKNGDRRSTNQFLQRSEQPAQDMSGESIKLLLANGLTLNLRGENHTGKIRLEPDGTAFGTAVLDSGKELDLSGTWLIEDDQFCRKWKFNKFKRVCETWRRKSETEVEVLINGKSAGFNSW